MPADLIPPGYYTVIRVDDDTVEIAEGPYAGRRIKSSLSPHLRLATAKVDVHKSETGITDHEQNT